MARPLKIIGIALGAIILLIAAALIAILLLFDPNAYKPQISQAVQDATGRELDIKGDIELSLFPWIGMELGQTSLSNASGFGDAPFARIDAAEVKLRLLPLLLRQEVETRAVVLRGLRLNLQVNENGTSNWADLAQPEPTATSGQIPPATPQQAAASTGGGIGLAALAIGGIEISDAHISYDDRAADTHYSVEQLNLVTGPVSLDTPVDVALDSRFSSSQPPLKGQLELSTRIGFDLKQERYRLDNLVLETTLDGEMLPGGRAQASVSADIQADLQQQTAALNNLEIKAYGVTARGQIDAERILVSPAFKGELALASFNARQLLTKLDQPVPDTADPEALTKLAANIRFSGTPTAINIPTLQLFLDDTTLSGQTDIHLPPDKPLPVVRYTLHIDTIDADRYLPPASENDVKVPPPSAGAAAAATLPMELLRDLDIKGQLDLDRLKISGLHISQIKTRLTAQQGLIELLPEAQLYQGGYKGSMQLDARQDTPRFKLDDALSGVQAGPLLQDLMDDALLSGRADLSSRLTTTGHTPEQMTRALNGRVEVSFNNGQIKGFNLAQLVREAKAKLNQQPLPARDETKGTDFTELSATLNIKDGVIHNDDLSAKSPYVRISGAGTVNLVTEQLDYLVKTALVESATGAGGAELEQLKGLTVPVKITGSFTQPKIDLQYDEILKARAKQELERKKQELKQKADAEKQQLQQTLEAEKEALQQELKDKQKQELQQKEDELKNKLKSLFN